MRCRRMMFPASIGIKSDERASRRSLNAIHGFMGECDLQLSLSRLLPTLAP